jgi:hypothetical protein
MDDRITELEAARIRVLESAVAELADRVRGIASRIEASMDSRSDKAISLQERLTRPH